MVRMQSCRFCDQGAPDRDLTKTYSLLGKTVVYADMLKDCFGVQLTLARGSCGVCLTCASRLRDASHFKLQVLCSEAELLAQIQHTEIETGVEPAPKQENDCHPIKKLEDVSKDETVSDEDVLVKSEDSLRSCDDLGDDATNDDVFSETEWSCAADADSSERLETARARVQLKLGCSVKLERLRELPHASQPCRVTSHRVSPPCPVTSHREPSPVTSHRESQPFPVTSHRESQPCPVTSHRESQPCPVTSHRESHAHTLEEQAYTHDTRPTLLTNDSSLNTHKQETITRTPVTNVDVYCCDMCSRGFTSKVTLIRHLLLHTRTQPPVPVHTCNVCKESFVSSSLLKKHSRFHSEDRPHVCAKCNKRFRTKDGLLVHSESHTEDKPYTYNGVKPHKCTECDAEFAYKPTLDTHMRRHFGRKYECDVCEKKYSHKAHLYNHLRIHTGKTFVCDQCKKQFISKPHLFRHVQIHGPKHQRERPYACQKCPKKYTRKDVLDVHYKVKHTDLKPFRCTLCDKRFALEYSLELHAISHAQDKPYNCKECNKQFKRKASLKYHKRAHRGEKPYKCKTCNKCFTSEMNLLEHHIIHTGEKPYGCSECDKRFRNRHNFYFHVKTDHGKMKVRPQFVQNIVAYEQVREIASNDQELSGRDSLETHTVEKPFNCEECNNKFTSNAELERHKRLHTDEQSYECEICEAIFFDEINLMKHLEKHRTRF